MSFAWVVTFEGQLDFLADWLAPMLARPSLAPVPKERLHVLIRAAGDADPAQLVAAARGRCARLAPIDALVGPVRAVADGVDAPLEPHEELRALHDALPGPPAEPFEPHVRFASGETDEIEIVASDAVLVDRVSLIEVDGWRVVATVPLGAPA